MTLLRGLGLAPLARRSTDVFLAEATPEQQEIVQRHGAYLVELDAEDVEVFVERR